jgi:hypothetical protein
VLWTAIKGYVVWDVAHDLFNGGGVPTLDFVIFCPIPVVLGLGFIFPSRLNCGGQVGAYVVLAILYGVARWLFDRIGAPARARQLDEMRRRSEAPPGAS